MTTKVGDVVVAEEQQQVINWRLDRMLAAGYELKHAERLAEDMTVDWHQAVDLYGKCDTKLIMKMLT